MKEREPRHPETAHARPLEPPKQFTAAEAGKPLSERVSAIRDELAFLNVPQQEQQKASKQPTPEAPTLRELIKRGWTKFKEWLARKFAPGTQTYNTGRTGEKQQPRHSVDNHPDPEKDSLEALFDAVVELVTAVVKGATAVVKFVTRPFRQDQAHPIREAQAS